MAELSRSSFVPGGVLETWAREAGRRHGAQENHAPFFESEECGGRLQGLEVAACGGGEGAEEELEWLSNKDAFPAVEEMDLELAVMGARRAQEELESLPNKDAFPTVEEMEQEPAVMGSRRKVVRRRRGAMSARPGQRRCRHCGTTKTPQWHRGAAGCRTLCNACGVRYKRERPEYAPSHQEGLEVGGGEALETMEAEPSEVGSQTKRVVRQRRTLAWPPTAAEPEQRWCQHCGKMKKPRWREGAAAEQEREWLLNKNVPAVETVEPKPSVVAPRTEGVVSPALSDLGQRLCRHCGTAETPQWREGPEGRKTLCNACGVRYRAGRLVPEYRPLRSPTFSPELHSNRHSRVAHMRPAGAPHPLPPDK
ncbi:GATA-type transcription factor SRE1-like [Triticum aestivum]|nr:GATA-type transcription factor SRE1-like [Triticum aestivum]